MRKIEIFVTNDDGIGTNGLNTLIDILREFGNVTVVAPAYAQSGMSAAVSLGHDIFYKELTNEDGLRIGKLTATPATCVKFGLMYMFQERYPDLIVSGINHGSNTSASVVYSGTLGAAAEGALHNITSVGVSIDSHSPDVNLDAVRRTLPGIISKILENPPKPGVFLNINYPDCPFGDIKGCSMASQGFGLWAKEFVKSEECTGAPEEGMTAYRMTGSFEEYPENLPTADHRLVEKNVITIVPHSIDQTDYMEMKRLSEQWDLTL